MTLAQNYEFGKSLKEQMRFKISLEFVMLRTLLGSEFQTVGAAKWYERSVADLRLKKFEQFFR